MLAGVTMALSLVLVKFGLGVTLVSAPAWMVMLLGSSSHMPPLPFGALALTSMPATSMWRNRSSPRSKSWVGISWPTCALRLEMKKLRYSVPPTC